MPGSQTVWFLTAPLSTWRGYKADRQKRGAKTKQNQTKNRDGNKERKQMEAKITASSPDLFTRHEAYHCYL